MYKEIKIFEGIDHTGKTTKISNYLKYADVHNVDTVHIEGKDPNTFEYYDEMFNDFKENKISSFIMDRAMIGELVYGPLYRDGSRISLIEIKKLFEKYKDVQFIIYISYVDKENFDKYIELLMERDHLINNPDELATEKWAEQCMFKNLICAIKAFNLKNVKIHEDEFIPGGKYEAI